MTYNTLDAFLKLLFMSDFWLSIIISNSVNHVKKDISKELMPVVQRPAKWRELCMPKDGIIQKSM